MKAAPVELSFQAKGARIAYFEWGGRDDPAVFLIHATGFHARVWDRTVAALPQRLRIIAVDVRGHGRSEKTGLMRDWSAPAQDLVGLVENLKLKGAIGVGHSMGGHLLVQIAAALPDAFKRLVLIDPVMLPPEIYANPHATALPEETEHPVARRRNKWASWQEMFEAFKHRHPYALWRPQVLEDYCRHGLVPARDGQGMELACPPAIEASIYRGHAGRDIYALAARVSVPVVVLRARPRAPGSRDVVDFAASPTWEGVARAFRLGRDVFLPHLTHFIPMQEPELTARFIADEHATA
jgi:pimeloyl-ACP methyl ester carboxylesterase